MNQIRRDESKMMNSINSQTKKTFYLNYLNENRLIRFEFSKLKSKYQKTRTKMCSLQS